MTFDQYVEHRLRRTHEEAKRRHLEFLIGYASDDSGRYWLEKTAAQEHLLHHARKVPELAEHVARVDAVRPPVSRVGDHQAAA